MLRKYTDVDFAYLREWITDAETLFRFSGPDWEFPLTREVLNAYIVLHPERQFYLGLNEEGVPFAFGEIITGDAHSPRLGRLLVGGEENRGKGLGQTFVKALIDETIKNFHSPELFLFVFDDNERGIACYKKCGFEFTGDEHARKDPQGWELNVLKMRKDLMNNVK